MGSFDRAWPATPIKDECAAHSSLTAAGHARGRCCRQSACIPPQVRLWVLNVVIPPI